MARLEEQFKREILPVVRKEFNVENSMQLPRLAKICLNMGVGKYHQDSKIVKQCAEELTLIAGQRAVKTLSRKSEAGFKVREGAEVGIRVTLRRARMWEFLDRFVNIASPRISDFNGFSRKGFDQRGNYNFGISEQTVFPEVDLDKSEAVQGMNITIVFENSSPDVSIKVLEMMGFPFERKGA